MANEQLFSRVDEYLEGLYEAGPPLAPATEDSLLGPGMPKISVSPVQGRFLNLLVQLCRAERILELGTLAGYSTIWMARGLPPGGQLVTIESDPHHAEVAWRNIVEAGVQDAVELRRGRGLDVLPQLQQEGAAPFDLIFIDADKPPLADYFEWALRLSRAGTLIIADNVIREGKVLDPESDDPMVRGVQRFNEILARHPAVVSSIMQTVGRKEHDGLAFALVK